MKILIVEDDVTINDMLKEALTKAGYICEQAFSGTEARLLLEKGGYCLVLLDLMLPGISGEEVLREVRREGDIPVVVLTARDSMDEKIGLLTGGADDYITKPFEIKEVIARVRIQLRHAGQEPEKERHILSHNEMVLDTITHQVSIAGVVLPGITRQEFAILELLLGAPKRVFSKEDIFEYAWNEPYMGRRRHWMFISAISARK